MPQSHSLPLSSPGLTKTSEAKWRSKGKRSAAVRPGDPVLPALVAPCESFGQSPALGPGSRDGLSVHTVRDDSLRETGKPCRETSTLRGRAKICVQQICQPVNGRRHGGACGNQSICSPSYRESGDGTMRRPPNPRRSAFLRKSRKHGPLNLAPLFLFNRRSTRAARPVVTAPFRAHLALILVEQLVLARARAVLHDLEEETKEACRDRLPVRKHQSCAVRPDSSGGRCRVPASADRKALLLRATCETIRPDFEDRNARCLFLRSRYQGL
jgi:hypothetical protein